MNEINLFNSYWINAYQAGFKNPFFFEAQAGGFGLNLFFSIMPNLVNTEMGEGDHLRVYHPVM